ncbi:MAG: phosphoribosylformylglycinamidine cyclo-ligase [Gammaproteobacteria bacterium]
MRNGQEMGATYRDAGVDIERGNAFVRRIKPYAQATHRPGVVGGIGGFGALFSLAGLNYRKPLLVSSTDGVGTKLKLAIDLDRHRTIGIDLVAMCANDVVVQGAEPLFFLDYFATGRLDLDTAEHVVAGIAQGCKLAGMALIGGETAEMPSLYHRADYDLAGVCVGVVEEDRLIDGHGVMPGDTIIGIASSGPHANGYSLIRKLITDSGADLAMDLGGRSLADTLIEPTRIYVKTILALLRSVRLRAIAHITGGGFIDNLPRVMPAGARAVITTAAWRWPPIFEWIRDSGDIETQEMYRTFNCGIGMVLIVSPDEAEAALEHVRNSGETAWRIGCVEAARADDARVVIDAG